MLINRPHVDCHPPAAKNGIVNISTRNDSCRRPFNYVKLPDLNNATSNYLAYGVQPKGIITHDWGR